LGLRLLLDKHATVHGLNRSFVYAICSRETNCVNMLGDFQGGEYHGVGVMQIDIQHDIARKARDDGSWETNPEPLIEFGCALLATNWARVREELPGLLGLLPDVQLKVAASGYNCGITRAISSVLNGDDSDAHTTGHDYGHDVIARMKIFDQLVTA
jgi:hypothetical protein